MTISMRLIRRLSRRQSRSCQPLIWNAEGPVVPSVFKPAISYSSFQLQFIHPPRTTRSNDQATLHWDRRWHSIIPETDALGHCATECVSSEGVQANMAYDLVR